MLIWFACSPPDLQNGQTLRQPMPQFRMTKEDAESVIAYLRSLHPAPH